nr:hypothetical protein GCM10017611_03420 [Rhodococcus wratislaviensis]
MEGALDDHPLSPVLTSIPGIGVRTAARILIEVGDGSAFPSAAHLAAYAGIAPITRKSGSSIRGEHPARSGNKKLKRALFLSALAALHDPISRAYYHKKRDEKKKHNAALICLARRRCDVLYAMLKTRNSTGNCSPQRLDGSSLWTGCDTGPCRHCRTICHVVSADRQVRRTPGIPLR